MASQLALPTVSLEQRVLPDPVTLAAMASQGASLALATTIATAKTMGACVQFYDWDEHPSGEYSDPIWVVGDIPASMRRACNALMSTYVSDDTWYWMPRADKVPRRRRFKRGGE